MPPEDDNFFEEEDVDTEEVDDLLDDLEDEEYEEEDEDLEVDDDDDLDDDESDYDDDDVADLLGDLEDEEEEEDAITVGDDYKVAFLKDPGYNDYVKFAEKNDIEVDTEFIANLVLGGTSLKKLAAMSIYAPDDMVQLMEDYDKVTDGFKVPERGDTLGDEQDAVRREFLEEHFDVPSDIDDYPDEIMDVRGADLPEDIRMDLKAIVHSEELNLTQYAKVVETVNAVYKHSNDILASQEKERIQEYKQDMKEIYGAEQAKEMEASVMKFVEDNYPELAAEEGWMGPLRNYKSMTMLYDLLMGDAAIALPKKPGTVDLNKVPDKRLKQEYFKTEKQMFAMKDNDPKQAAVTKKLRLLTREIEKRNLSVD